MTIRNSSLFTCYREQYNCRQRNCFYLPGLISAMKCIWPDFRATTSEKYFALDIFIALKSGHIHFTNNTQRVVEWSARLARKWLGNERFEFDAC